MTCESPMPESLLSLALEWLKLDSALKALRKSESDKRAELVLACFPAGLVDGTNTAELARGYKVKAVSRPAPKFPDKKALQTALDKLRAMGSVGVLLAIRLVTYTPVLSIAEWKKLEPKQRALFKTAIVIGASTPSVELVEPSA
jgi:hypothetical protein